MTAFHKSSLAIRRIAFGSQLTRRMYSHLTPPLFRASSANGSTSSSRSKADGWLVPAAIAVFGLGFSTFSTHQLMSCSRDDMRLRKK